jgi:hypothetical protein
MFLTLMINLIINLILQDNNTLKYVDLPVPHHTFHHALFRQPSLAEGLLKPQPYRRVHSLSDPSGVVRGKSAKPYTGKGDFSAMDSYDDQQKSETPYKDFDPRSISKNGAKRDTSIVSPLRSTSYSVERIRENCDLSTGKITQSHFDSEKVNSVFPPKIQIPKGMGLNMCEYFEFNSSMSSADPNDVDFFYGDDRYNPAHTRSGTNTHDEEGEKGEGDGEGEEEEDRDSGDERDVNEILECNGHFDVVGTSECVPEDTIVEDIVSPLKSTSEYRFNIHADRTSRGEYTTIQDRNQRRIFTVPDLGIRITCD